MRKVTWKAGYYVDMDAFAEKLQNIDNTGIIE